ncbi:MAG: site-specific integrase, partial [Terriglobia bacterium]|nr:site-specific integrase [Terriglobia bacterium]
MAEKRSQVQKGIDQFLYSLRASHASEHTIKAYSIDLDQFAVFLGADARWRDIDHMRIRSFLSHL